MKTRISRGHSAKRLLTLTTQVLDRERGDEMARGEYKSGKALMEYIPDATNAPIAWEFSSWTAPGHSTWPDSATPAICFSRSRTPLGHQKATRDVGIAH